MTDLPVAHVLDLSWGRQALVGISPRQHELGGWVSPLLALCLIQLDQLVGDSRGQRTPGGGGYVAVQGDGGHIQTWQHCLLDADKTKLRICRVHRPYLPFVM